MGSHKIGLRTVLTPQNTAGITCNDTAIPNNAGSRLLLIRQSPSTGLMTLFAKALLRKIPFSGPYSWPANGTPQIVTYAKLCTNSVTSRTTRDSPTFPQDFIDTLLVQC